MKADKRFIGPLLVMLAGVFWGSMGIFVRTMSGWGFSSIQITAVRLTLASVFFLILLLLRSPADLQIRLRDIPLFLALGVISILFFTICYFTAITMLSLSTAAILLYTSPIWVMLMSVVFFHEKFTSRKLLALAMAFGGCILVSGLSGGSISTAGLLFGLGSGIGYALYSIFGTVALRRYSPLTVTTYAFLIAAAGIQFISPPAELASLFAAAVSPAKAVLFAVVMALFSAVTPYLLYTLGLARVEASKAAILATVEPLVATLVGVLVFSEPLTVSSLIGILLILAAIVLLNTKSSAS